MFSVKFWAIRQVFPPTCLLWVCVWWGGTKLSCWAVRGSYPACRRPRVLLRGVLCSEAIRSMREWNASPAAGAQFVSRFINYLFISPHFTPPWWVLNSGFVVRPCSTGTVSALNAASLPGNGRDLLQTGINPNTVAAWTIQKEWLRMKTRTKLKLCRNNEGYEAVAAFKTCSPIIQAE